MVDTFDKLLLELERCLMGTSRRQFTDEFKRESVGLLASSGRPLSQIARELGIAASMLRSWRGARAAGRVRGAGWGRSPPAARRGGGRPRLSVRIWRPKTPVCGART